MASVAPAAAVASAAARIAKAEAVGVAPRHMARAVLSNATWSVVFWPLWLVAAICGVGLFLLLCFGVPMLSRRYPVRRRGPRHAFRCAPRPRHGGYRCPKPQTEGIFNAIVAGLLLESGRLRPGQSPAGLASAEPVTRLAILEKKQKYYKNVEQKTVVQNLNTK